MFPELSVDADGKPLGDYQISDRKELPESGQNLLGHFRERHAFQASWQAS